MKKTWILIATFFNVGKFPFAPGTLTSLVAAGVFYIANLYLAPTLFIQVATIVFLFLLGIPAAAAAEKHFGKKDPGAVVIDEVAGQMVALTAIPLSIPLYIAGFFLVFLNPFIKSSQFFLYGS